MDHVELTHKEHQEQLDAIMDIRAVLATINGKNFIKYLFKNLEVGQLPEIGWEGNILHDKLGFLRAGKSVYDLVNAADPIATANILVQVTKETNA